jgi:hypothetical protein
MEQAFMPRNVAMASRLILGLAIGLAGIGTTVFRWLADWCGIPFTLQAIFSFLLLLQRFLISFPIQRVKRLPP